MPYRLKISGLQYESEIEGSGDWTRSVVRDFNDRIFRTRGGYEFTGHQGLYNLLYNNLSLNGVCQSLTARVYFNTGSSWDYEWRGQIKPQDFDFDLLKRSAAGQILDDSWSAKFDNSKEQKVFLRSTTSKNGVAIPQCDFNGTQFFDPSDAVLGNYLADRRTAFRIYDVFAFLVRYYSDDTVTFASDFFDIGGDGDQFYITTGKEIRLGNNTANPEVSFDEVFDEMNKKCNLWIIIEADDLDNPVLRIEPWEYVFKSEQIIEVVDPENISLTTDLDQLYTIINVGSSAAEFDPLNDANYPTPRFESWTDESYNTPGDCEFENNTLNLVSTWKIDTNTIEKVIDGDDGFDEDIFLVEIDPTAPDYDAFKFTTELTGSDTVEYIYNFNLTNEQVILKWFDGIPEQMTKYIGLDYYVYADTPTTGSFLDILHELDFTNDSVAPATDPDDIYTTAGEASGDDSSGEFKSPLDLAFDFDVSVAITNGPGNKPYEIWGYIYEDNTRGQLLRITKSDSLWYVPGESKTITYTGTLFMNASNVLVWVLALRSTPINYTINSAHAELQTGVLEYNTAPDDPLIYVYNADRFQLSESNFDLLDQGRGFVRIIDTNQQRRYDVYAKDVKWNRNTCVVESGEFIGGRPPVELCWVLTTGDWDDDCYWFDTEYWNE